MMLLLACIACLFLLMQLTNVMLNLIFRQKLHGKSLMNSGRASVLIPARNEEKKIGNLLEDLLRIEQPDLEIIVFDDNSEDRTAQIVKNFSKKDGRVSLIQSTSLPEGWLGKNHACYQLAKRAAGEYYLFLDADVRIEGSVIRDAVAHMQYHNLKLLSLFPKQELKTIGEKLTVPVMNYILLSLLPLIFVRKSPYKAHAAANGQFMLFDAETYRHVQPHVHYKDTVVEDIAIAGYYKQMKLNVACLTNEARVKCRMYTSYREALQGFSRNVFMFFGNIPVMAFIFWGLSAFGFVPVLIALPEILIIYFGGMLAVLIMYAILSKQNIILSVVLFPAHMVFLLQILINGMLIKSTKQMKWKGRYVNS
ncbi:MAG: glycosyltransferase [Bacteroidales bacterium]